MNSIVKHIFILFISAQMITFAQDCKSSVSITTNKTDALIFINDSLIGKGFADVNLSVGKYKLRVTQSANLWGKTPFEQVIEVNDCNTGADYTVTFANEFLLRSDPPDVTVFKGDSLIGHTPLFLSPHSGQITLRKKNYSDFTFNTGTMEGRETISLDFTGTANGTSFFKRDIFKILLGSALLLGGTTAYFKIKADNRFEDYKISREERLLRETERYDLISGIAFGALQINFGVLIYYFLTD